MNLLKDWNIFHKKRTASTLKTTTSSSEKVVPWENQESKKFPQERQTKPTRIFETISSDLKGPILTPSKGGYRYYITFNCLYSKWSWIHSWNTRQQKRFWKRRKGSSLMHSLKPDFEWRHSCQIMDQNTWTRKWVSSYCKRTSSTNELFLTARSKTGSQNVKT